MSVKIEINRLNDGFHLQGVNDNGNTVDIDASPDIGGQGLGMRPMQLLLTSLGACGTMDIINILKKQRQPLEDIKITVTGEREPGVEPAPYIAAHIHFRLFGKLDQDKVQKAVSLSVEKYCSVAETIKKTTKITYSFEII
ncbi:MAG TPA: OsmC family protein [Cyclobacteriaceae bacterium]|nr:OsmC family protein [Cyclobacteriaceae bacterium]